MAKNRAKIRILAALAVIAAAFLLSGCGASLTVYEYSTGEETVHVYELAIDADTVRAMEDSAISKNDGTKYTVSDYFFTLFDGFSYSLVDASMTESGYRAQFKKTFGADVIPDLYAIGTALEYSTEFTENPFTRKYSLVSQNPFNGVRARYDEVTDPDKSATIIQQLKNGIVTHDEYGNRTVVFPAVQAAFPYLTGIDPSGLLLDFALSGSARMESSGLKSETANGAFYFFPRYFDSSQTNIEFVMTRPVSYGWYLVAVAAGALTVAVFVLVTRQKKQKPTLLDRFPYNPEEYRDYESHLPMNR